MVFLSNITIDLAGKTALITGATRGIGKAIAEKLFEAGAAVLLTGTKAEEIDSLNAENNEEQIEYLHADFSSEDSTNIFLSQIESINAIDILINNAGINIIDINTETSTEDFNLISEINLKAPYLLCREVSKKMKQQGYGRIVNITSIWSFITRPGRSIYTTTKWGLVGLTKALSVELAEHDILVNAVGPGFTLTELTTSTNSPEELEKISNMIPIGRMAMPEEIANVVLFLSSNLNTYLTGQNIIIDGGYTNI